MDEVLDETISYTWKCKAWKNSRFPYFAKTGVESERNYIGRNDEEKFLKEADILRKDDKLPLLSMCKKNRKQIK